MFDAIRNRPEEVTVSIAPGAGNHWHIGFAALAQALEADVSAIPYAVCESRGAARTALLGQHINLNVVALGVMAPFHESGDVKCVAVASRDMIDEGSLPECDPRDTNCEAACNWSTSVAKV